MTRPEHLLATSAGVVITGARASSGEILRTANTDQHASRIIGDECLMQIY